MRLNLDRIENQLQSFIENRMVFTRRQNTLAQQLVEAMREHLKPDANGNLAAPANYLLSIHPQTLSSWQSSPELLDRLAEVLQNAAQEQGVRFSTPPMIRLTADPTLPVDSTKVAASMQPDGGTTAALPVSMNREAGQGSFPPGAFLIVNGTDTFPLRLPVINLGRRLSNHVIINDVRVSRAHAQLRAVRGRYVLFDLNSSGGTFVNGLRITQQTLKPGDVISLAGVPIIYGEETPPSESDTTAYFPDQSHHPDPL
jgi:hypothetical protein